MGEGGRSAAVDAQIEDSDPVGRVRDAMRRLRNELGRPDFPGFLAKIGYLSRKSRHM